MASALQKHRMLNTRRFKQQLFDTAPESPEEASTVFTDIMKGLAIVEKVASTKNKFSDSAITKSGLKDDDYSILVEDETTGLNERVKLFKDVGSRTKDTGFITGTIEDMFQPTWNRIQPNERGVNLLAIREFDADNVYKGEIGYKNFVSDLEKKDPYALDMLVKTNDQIAIRLANDGYNEKQISQITDMNPVDLKFIPNIDLKKLKGKGKNTLGFKTPTEESTSPNILGQYKEDIKNFVSENGGRKNLNIVDEAFNRYEAYDTNSWKSLDEDTRYRIQLAYGDLMNTAKDEFGDDWADKMPHPKTFVDSYYYAGGTEKLFNNLKERGWNVNNDKAQSFIENNDTLNTDTFKDVDGANSNVDVITQIATDTIPDDAPKYRDTSIYGPQKDQILIDAFYKTRDSRFRRQLEDRGYTIGGGDMLVIHQDTGEYIPKSSSDSITENVNEGGLNDLKDYVNKSTDDIDKEPFFWKKQAELVDGKRTGDTRKVDLFNKKDRNTIDILNDSDNLINEVGLNIENNLLISANEGTIDNNSLMLGENVINNANSISDLNDKVVNDADILIDKSADASNELIKDEPRFWKKQVGYDAEGNRIEKKVPIFKTAGKITGTVSDVKTLTDKEVTLDDVKSAVSLTETGGQIASKIGEEIGKKSLEEGGKAIASTAGTVIAPISGVATLANKDSTAMDKIGATADIISPALVATPPGALVYGVIKGLDLLEDLFT